MNADGRDAAGRIIYIKTHQLRDTQAVAVLQSVHGGDRLQAISKAARAQAARPHTLRIPDSDSLQIVSRMGEPCRQPG